MTHGALHGVLRHQSICFWTNYALNVVGQKAFEIHTKHHVFSLPAALVLLLLVKPASFEGAFNLCLAHRNNFHPPENLGQFNTATINS